MAEVDTQDVAPGVYIDGESYTLDDLTFAEQAKVRRLIKEANADDPKFDFDKDAAIYDFAPALVTVVRQREDPSYSYAQAADLRFEDLSPPADKAGADGPPTEEG